MPWGIAAGVVSAGVGLYGASQQAGAAKDAAGQQQQASRDQLALDANVFNAQAGMNLPTRELGGLAQSRLAFLTGLSPNLDISPDFATPNINAQPGSGQPGLTWNGPTSGYNWNNTGSGNPTMPGALQPTTYNGLSPMYGTNSNGAQGPSPSGAPGTSASNPTGFGGSTPAAGGFGSLASPYDPSTFYQDPGYNFIQDQTSQALNRAGASSGQLGSGAQLKAAMSYASGLASQEFNNAYNRSVNTQTTMFNELNALGTGGQVATGATTTAAGNLGTAASSALAGYGNAGAAGTIGAGNAWTSGINGVSNSLTSLGMNYYNNQQNPSMYSLYGAPSAYPPAQSPPLMSAGGGYTYNNPAYSAPVQAPN
jgi:hypothetical protein